MAKHWVAVIVVAMVSLGGVTAGGDAVDDEYSKRLKSLSPTDIKGQMELAKWCRQQGKWQLVAERCNHVLRIHPNHKQAKLLLDLARSRLDKNERGVGRSRGGPAAGGDGPRMLTDEEVQRIRRAEMYLDDREHVVLKIDRSALRAFYDSAHHKGQIDLSRRDFFRLPRLQQAQLVLEYAGEKFGNKITVQSDPLRMRTFIRRVEPIVLHHCATSECHGGRSAGKFRLIPGRTLSTNASYANFLIMHGYSVNGMWLINRDQPKNSLLLTYALPPGVDADARTGNHPTAIAPPFANQRDRNYQTVLDWISSLAIDRPDYGIDLKEKK